MAGTGMLAILIEIKVIELYKKNCWDVITLLMILTSVAIVIYFGESIKKVLSVNLLLLFVLSQGAYVGIRCYLKVWLAKKTILVFSTYCIDSKITPYQPSENLLYEKKYYREKRL